MDTNNKKNKKKLEGMIVLIDSILDEAKSIETNAAETLENIHPEYQKSAVNLLHYRALRSFDLRKLQKKLGNMGLSRLAKSQSHVMASLQTTRSILKALVENEPIQTIPEQDDFKYGNDALKSNAKQLLGYRKKSRRTRIMVTMPSSAADDYQLVHDILEAGMNCARVNCAHDSPEVWKRIIDNVRQASKQLDKKCKIAMDLAGPKIRTGAIEAGPKVLKIRPKKDLRGQIVQALEIWIGYEPREGYPHVPIARQDYQYLTGTETLYFRDARGKKRSFPLILKENNGFIAYCEQTTVIESGLQMYTDKKRNSTPIKIGELPAQEVPLLLKNGDALKITKAPIIGKGATYDEGGQLVASAHISCTAPAIFDEVYPGERILFDDGKIEGVIRTVHPDELLIEIVHAADGGAKLRADKGINLPDSKLTISGLTAKDRKDLEFVVQHADVINFSFVNRPQDVRELFEALEALDAKNKQGIILKIETQSGFNQLTEILLEAMHNYPTGVMIARGDLAIECGWNNIGRVQEEILSLCQAAHVTDIWATQVLEGLAKRGLPSRAEITDAVMAQRADCVMLNKGPYILEAIQLLDTILTDMEPYWEKNAPLSPMMETVIKKQ